MILPENRRIADGCPCNSPRGVNHGRVPKSTCTCVVCDPDQTGASRYVDELMQITSSDYRELKDKIAALESMRELSLKNLAAWRKAVSAILIDAEWETADSLPQDHGMLRLTLSNWAQSLKPRHA